MYTYKDRIYCQFYKQCKKGKTCPNVLRKDEYEEIKCEALIEYMREKPKCFKEK